MEIPIYLYFLIAVAATFVGALPFVAINLSVINTTLTKSFNQGFHFSLAASLVEIFEAVIAISFGVVIQTYLMEHDWIQVLIFTVFIGLGVYNLVRVTHPTLKERSKRQVPEFVKGLLIAIANPQAVPFWLFTLAFIAQSFQLDFIGINLTAFLLGVFVGKFLALLLFGILSNYLRERLKKSCNLINKSFGAILLIIGVGQAFQYFKHIL